MKAVDSHLLTLLRKSKQFIVPIYQRPYSWQDVECAQLWADVIRAGSREGTVSHFTGSIVYVAKEEVTNSTAEPDLLIDGQQRVTTVTLLLAALAARLMLLPADQREPWGGFSPEMIRNRFLMNEDEDGERQFKLILSRNDKAALMAVLQGAPRRRGVITRVRENYEFFRRRLADVDLAIVCKGLDSLVVVDVQLERGVDNPQLVFEAMNSTGKALSPADLIRNYILMDLPPRQQESLYHAHWRPMEIEFSNASEDQFGEFVRDYLAIKTRDSPALKDIYDAFKKYADQFHGRGETMEGLVIELSQYARRYSSIILSKRAGDVLSRELRDLSLVQRGVVNPFLLEVYTDYEDGMVTKKAFREIVSIVTSYLVRRSVCGLPSNSYNRIFAELSSSLRKDRYLDSVRERLLEMKGQQRFPSHEDFVTALKTGNLYKSSLTIYILRMLEDYSQKRPTNIAGFTIEHIMPQNEALGREWRRSLGWNWRKVHTKYLHTLGNLTLTQFNSRYSDKPFSEKRDMENGFGESALHLNQEVAQNKTWNSRAIERRGARLADRACEIWPRPVPSAGRIPN